MNAPTGTPPAPEGTVLGYIIVDPDTREACYWCSDREEGRALKRETGGWLCKLVKTH